MKVISLNNDEIHKPNITDAGVYIGSSEIHVKRIAT